MRCSLFSYLPSPLHRLVFPSLVSPSSSFTAPLSTPPKLFRSHPPPFLPSLHLLWCLLIKFACSILRRRLLASYNHPLLAETLLVPPTPFHLLPKATSVYSAILFSLLDTKYSNAWESWNGEWLRPSRGPRALQNLTQATQIKCDIRARLSIKPPKYIINWYSFLSQRK